MGVIQTPESSSGTHFSVGSLRANTRRAKKKVVSRAALVGLKDLRGNRNSYPPPAVTIEPGQHSQKLGLSIESMTRRIQI